MKETIEPLGKMLVAAVMAVLITVCVTPALAADSDGDGVPDEIDMCPDTKIPELTAPRARLRLKRDHFALTTPGSTKFDTVQPAKKSYTTADTGGCSCEQISSKLNLAKVDTKYGCSITSMDTWDAIVASVPKQPSDLAPVPQTGITTSYGVDDDGALQMGVPWPIPRFTDNADGTVTDNLTKLIWLKDAGCAVEKNWENALNFCNTLANGNCGLSDGSQAGDWRLPNIRELHSLIHYGFGPTLPNTAGTGRWTEGDPFTNVQMYWYWTSTTDADSYDAVPCCAWHITMDNGWVTPSDKLNRLPVWPVRDGK